MLVDLQKHRADAEAGQPPQMQIEQLTGKAAAPAVAGDRQNFGLVGGQPRHDEAGKAAPGQRTLRDHGAVGEQAFDFLLAPAAPERRGVQGGNGRRIARLRVGKNRRGLREQSLQKSDHRRASRAAVCGCASGGRK